MNHIINFYENILVNTDRVGCKAQSTSPEEWLLEQKRSKKTIAT